MQHQFAVSRVKRHNGIDLTQWLICNGMNMGRWKISFDVTTIADTFDCVNFARNIHGTTKDATLHEVKIMVK